MEVKFQNPFAKKRQALKEAAAGTCKGCGANLPDMTHTKVVQDPMTGGKTTVVIGEDTIRSWCARPKRAECRKLYRAKTRARTAARHV